MNSIKGIIFDYGGTIDTNGIHWGEFIWEQYRKAGVDVSHETYRNAYVYGERYLAKHPIVTSTDTFRTLLEKKIAIQFEYLRTTSQETEFCGTLATRIAEECYIKVKETLETTCRVVKELSSRYPTVLVTNFYGNMPVVLEEFNLSEYFICIIESSVVGLRKPDPSLFAMGIEALGLVPDVIAVIGDSYRKDIYPASTLGCKTIWIKNICWEEEPLIEGHKATYTIRNLEELPKIIEQI